MDNNAGVSKGKSIASMACGIAGIVGSFGWGVGLVLAIVALVLSKKYVEEAGADNAFSKAGRITGIIGLILSVIGLVVCIACAACTGAAACASAAVNGFSLQ